MTQRSSAGLAWSLGILALAATCAEITLLLLGPGLPLNSPDQAAAIDFLENLLAPVVGVLIAWKRPANPVGWLLLAYAVADGFGGLLAAYAERGIFADPGSLPGAAAAAWLTSWIWVPYIGLIPLLLLYFPSGRLPSPRWRPVPWLYVVPVALIAVVAVAFLGVPAREYWFFWEGTVPGLEWTRGFVAGALAILVAFVVIALVSLVFRYRRAAHEERQQLKWVMLAAGIVVVQAVFENYLPGPPALKAAVGAIAFASIPASIGIAILRYRLYDIDVIINRTLVYGALTALLLLVYGVGVVGLGAVLQELTDAESNSLAVAASTLAVAALFRPARARIQAFIDRRFYRAKYDAARTLDTFSARLRDEVDIDDLSAHLLGAIQDTMQPAHASLWLRSGAGR